MLKAWGLDARAAGLAVMLLYSCQLGCDGSSSDAPDTTATTGGVAVVEAGNSSASAVSSASPDAGTASLPAPPLAELSAADRERIDQEVQRGIEGAEYAGAVVVVLRRGRVVLRKAYGARSLEPTHIPMRADAVFDLASLTKPVVTATAVMQLVERGALALHKPVSRYLPTLIGGELAPVTVAQLLSHTSGLPAANDLKHYREGRGVALRRISALALRAAPGSRRIYSDVGYILLGELVAALAGMPLESYAERHILAPLGMADSAFKPGTALSARAVPSERRNGTWLQGRVHDPRADALGGVAGHAGLFSTGDDLARFCAMLLGASGPGVLLAGSVETLSSPMPGSGAAWALGFSRLDGGYGHTGFTGTSMWLDPRHGSALIVLTSRLHPDGRGSAKRIRRALRSILLQVDRRQEVVSLGIDQLVEAGFAPLRGRRVGLVTHRAAVASDGRRSVDVLHQAQQVELVALFSPEHGLGAEAEGVVADGIHAATGLPIRSLYGSKRRPTAAQLADVDTLAVDLQDAGARFYTYATTLGYLLEAAAERGLKVLVLDRPNPIDGVHVQGPLLDPDRISFVGYHPIPVRHGMTLGELARLYAHERKLVTDLQVVPMRGWKRQQRFEETGHAWIPPSPNLRTAEAALLYPGVALLELTNVSVGRGTEEPFGRIGAPWMDPQALLRELDATALVGVEATPTAFTPAAGPHAGERCQGLELAVVDAARVRPVRLGLALGRALLRRHASVWQPAGMLTLLGNEHAFQALLRGASVDAIEATWADDLRRFEKRRRPHLLY